jgi:hypothetical protein
MPVQPCAVCGRSCISRCPVCRKYVHPGYGYQNDGCSQKHEGLCRKPLPETEPVRFPEGC